MDVMLQFTGATGRDVSDLLSDIGERIVDQAHAAAANKTMTTARTDIRKVVSRETSAPSKLLTKRFRLHRANRNKPEARLFIGTVPIRAVDMGAKVLKRGVSFRSGGSRVKATSAFYATMKSGHIGIFQREGRKRLPIKELTVPVHASARRAADAFIANRAADVNEKNFRHELQFRIRREIDRQGLRLQ